MDPLRRLTQINLDDLVMCFGVKDKSILTSLFRKIFHKPAEKFASQLLKFDNDVAVNNLRTAAQKLFDQYAKSLEITGYENIPDKGPVLIVSNHPGMVDTLALFCAIKREDLKIFAFERPLLMALKNTSSRLIYVNDDDAKRMTALMAGIDHLRQNGALLTYPAGKIEPDPDFLTGATGSLDSWSRSAGVLANLAPNTKIIPTLVTGVLWKKIFYHPLTKIKKTKKEKENMGAALQLLGHIMLNTGPLNVKIQFAKPISAASTNSKNPSSIQTKIIKSMRQLIKVHQNVTPSL